mgnify:CR=1 FL=1
MQGINKFGVGTDIESIARFRNLDFNRNKTFFNKIFTKKEMEYCLSKKEPAAHLAARYAGKEAIIKALSSIGKEHIDYKKVEIFNNKKEVPLVKITDKRFKGLKVHLSLSHCEDKALAFAIVMETKQ